MSGVFDIPHCDNMVAKLVRCCEACIETSKHRAAYAEALASGAATFKTWGTYGEPYTASFDEFIEKTLRCNGTRFHEIWDLVRRLCEERPINHWLYKPVINVLVLMILSVSRNTFMREFDYVGPMIHQCKVELRDPQITPEGIIDKILKPRLEELCYEEAFRNKIVDIVAKLFEML